MIRKILFAHLGENAGTDKFPVGEYTGQDLTKIKTVCRSWDDDGLTTVPYYEVREIALPDWLSVAEYCRDAHTWRSVFFLYCDCNCSETVGRGWFTLQEQGTLYARCAKKLLDTKNFRSEFRRSLCEQSASWLMAPEPKYQSPLSAKQWENLLR